MAGNTNKEIEIDYRNFNKMVRELRKYSSIKTRPLIRGVTSDVLHAAAGRTKTGTVGAIKDSLDKAFRQPFEVPGKGFIGVTKNGKVWVNLVRWGNKQKWLLTGTDGKMRNVKADQHIKKGARQGKFDKQTARDINELFAYARKWRRNENKYRKSLIGLSQAAWLRAIRILNLPVRQQRGISKKAYTVNMPPKAKAAIKAFEQVRGRDDFTVVVSNAVQATLNKNANGMNAFKLAMNGQAKRFHTAAKKDFKGYVKQFSDRHGFTVK